VETGDVVIPATSLNDTLPTLKQSSSGDDGSKSVIEQQFMVLLLYCHIIELIHYVKFSCVYSQVAKFDLNKALNVLQKQCNILQHEADLAQIHRVENQCKSEFRLWQSWAFESRFKIVRENARCRY
jgi:hypothetical protein